MEVSDKVFGITGFLMSIVAVIYFSQIPFFQDFEKFLIYSFLLLIMVIFLHISLR
ncbi:MAG: hypothetical protein QW734_07065 [Candidatus Bathyarchaeia archaeon]